MSTSFVRELLAYIETPHDTVPATSGAMLARVLACLVEHEYAPGGPYVLTKGGDDTDIGFNLIIALFLRLHEVSLTALDGYIARTRAEGELRSVVVSDEVLAQLFALYDAPPSQQAEEAECFSKEREDMLVLVQSEVAAYIATLPPAFQEAATFVTSRTIAGNPDGQMSLMPLFMREALGTLGEQHADTFIAKLGAANVCFWTSFIVYDDFWDEDEAAEARLLPVANLLARRYIDYFTHLFPENPAFRAFFHEIMDTLDAANHLETVSFRLRTEEGSIYVPEQLPDYGDYDIKFYPAAGHVFGPVALLVSCGYAVRSTEVSRFVSYCRHYLIAMQIHDDLHDWKEDLLRGHISTAVCALLAAWNRAHPGRDCIDLGKDMPELERLFWFSVLPSLTDAAAARTACAREELASLYFLENPEPLAALIERNERITAQARAAYEKSAAFLAALEK